MKFYSGKFRPSFPEKYRGNLRNIKYRSLWERQVFKWCDTCGDILEWSSEEIAIPYRCKTDGKTHIYYPDLKVKFANGETHLVEIKPKNQTREPKKQSRVTKKYLIEVLTYAKNISKWEAASAWSEKQGYKFNVWTEETIKSFGIKLLT